MKHAALSVYLLCLSALFFSSNGLRALTIPASEDSYTAPGNKLSLATNNANSLIVDANRKSYLYFDLSDIPTDAVVRWAKLRLFLPIVQRPGAGLSVHLVNSEWNESKASTSLPTLAAGTIGVITPDKMASRRFVTVDVTSTVQKWIKGGTINGGTMNEGFAVQPIVKAGSPTASVMLTSKEGPVFGLPAELDIEFQPEGGLDKPVTFDQVPPSIRSYFGPTITVQPSGASGNEGSLTVTASGIGPLTYQWKRDGEAIDGGTNSQLPTRGLHSGTYTVVVSNGFASVASGSIQFNASTTTSMLIRADIDHESIIEISPLGVRWENLEGNRPGTLDGTGHVATSVNEIEWFAKWPDDISRSHGFSNYAEFHPGYFKDSVSVTVLSSRMNDGLLDVIQQPSVLNNFTL